MTMPPKECIFCQKGPVTKEDVWPTWLTSYIPRNLPRHAASISIINPHGKITKTRKIWGSDPRSTRAKCVCATCNSGWMSVLQNKAKPIVLPLAQGLKTVLSLDDQCILSAWIAMCTITSEFFVPAFVAIPRIDRDFLWNNETAPEYWKIWIGKYQRGDWPPYRVHHAFHLSDGDRDGSVLSPSTPPNAQTTTLVFGQLYAHVFSCAFPFFVDRVNFNSASHLLRPIWPPQNAPLVWPLPSLITDKDADHIAGAIFLFSTGLIDKKPKSQGPFNG